MGGALLAMFQADDRIPPAGLSSDSPVDAGFDGAVDGLVVPTRRGDGHRKAVSGRSNK